MGRQGEAGGQDLTRESTSRPAHRPHDLDFAQDQSSHEGTHGGSVRKASTGGRVLPEGAAEARGPL